MVYLECSSPELKKHNARDTQNSSTFVKQHPFISKLEKNIIKMQKISPPGIICTFVS